MKLWNRDFDISKYRLFKIIFFLMLVLIAIIFAFKDAADAKIYITASGELINGHSPYEQLYETTKAGELKTLDDYIYSPLFTVILAPLSLLPIKIGLIIFQLLGVLFFTLIWREIRFFLNVRVSGEKIETILFFLSSFLVIRFLGQNIERGQITFFLLLASFAAIRLIVKDRKIYGASLLALAMNIKLMPMTLIPYLIYRREFKATIFTLFFFVFFLFLPTIFVGWDRNVNLHQEWWNEINPAKAKFYLDTREGHYDISSWISTLIHEIPSEKVDATRHIVDLPVEQVKIITNLLKLLLIGFTVYFLKFDTIFKMVDKRKMYWELSYLFLITPLIFPFQSKYAFFYIFPAAAYLTYFLIRFWEGQSKISLSKVYFGLCMILLFFILANLTSLNIVSRDIYNLSQHYKTISYGTLCLITALALFHPKYLNE